MDKNKNLRALFVTNVMLHTHSHSRKKITEIRLEVTISNLKIMTYGKFEWPASSTIHPLPLPLFKVQITL